MPAVAAVLVLTAEKPTRAAILAVSGNQTGDLPLVKSRPASTIVVAPLDPTGRVSLAVSTGSTPVTVDVLGYYTGAVIRSARTKVLGAAAAATIALVSPDSITFSGKAPASVRAIALGDVVVVGVSAMTPAGLLRKVTNVTPHADGSRTLSTAQAALSDAVISGTGSTRSVAPRSASAPRATLAHSVDRSYPFDELFGGDTASLHVEGSLRLHAEMDLDVSVHASLFHPVDAQLTVAAQENFNGDATATADLAYEKEINLAEEEEPTIPLDIAGVPVVVTPKITIDLEISAAAHGDISASISQTRGYVATLAYTGGHTSATSTPTGGSPTFGGPAGSATAEIKVGEKFAYHFLLEGVAGPYVSGEPFLRVSTDGCGAALSYGVDLAGGMEARILDYSISIEKSFETLTGLLATTGYHCSWSGQLKSVQAGSGKCDGALSCTFNIAVTFTPVRTDERLAPNATPAQWTLVFGYDYSISYSLTIDDSTGGCVDYNVTTGVASGHVSSADSGAKLAWHYGQNPDAYWLDAAIVPFTGSEHFVASGGPGCQQLDETVATPIIWGSAVPVPGVEGAIALSGEYDEVHSGNPPIVHTWDLVRHLPGT